MTLYILCGVPGSGKSTMSMQIAKEQNAKLYSYDEIKRDSKLTSFDDICELIYQRIITDLSNGFNVVYDAPHTKIKHRVDTLEHLAGVYCTKVLIVMKTPLDECLRRNSRRQGHEYIPEPIIHDFYNSFEPPNLDEGWDEIREVRPYEVTLTSD